MRRRRTLMAEMVLSNVPVGAQLQSVAAASIVRDGRGSWNAASGALSKLSSTGALARQSSPTLLFGTVARGRLGQLGCAALPGRRRTDSGPGRPAAGHG